MEFKSLECLLLKQWKQDTILPSLFGFSLPCFHFLLLWWFFTRKDRGMLELLWRTGERRRRLSVWQRWEGSSGSCWTQTAERLSACSLANSFADGRWYGREVGVTRGNFHRHQCRTNNNKRTSGGGGTSVSISGSPTKQVYEGAQRRFKPERGPQSSHFSQARAHSHFRRDRHTPLVFGYYIKLKFSKDIRVLTIKTCLKLEKGRTLGKGLFIRRTMLHTSIHNVLLIRQSSAYTSVQKKKKKN